MNGFRVFALLLSASSFFVAASFVVTNNFYYVVLFSLVGLFFLGVGLIIGAWVKKRGG